MPFPKGARRSKDGRLIRASIPPEESGDQEEQTAAETPGGAPAEAQATVVGKRKGGTSKPKRSWDAPVTVGEVQSAAYHLFVVLGTMLGSRATWEVSEFQRLAEGYVSVANRLPLLRVIVLVVTPLSVLGEIIEKARKLRAGVPPRKGARQEQQASA